MALLSTTATLTTKPSSSFHPSHSTPTSSSSVEFQFQTRTFTSLYVLTPPAFRRNLVTTSTRCGVWKRHSVCMAPQEETMTRRSPLDFPLEWERPKPPGRPDIFPQFSPMKTPLPPPMPADPPEENEEEEKEDEDNLEKEEEQEKPEKKIPTHIGILLQYILLLVRL